MVNYLEEIHRDANYSWGTVGAFVGIRFGYETRVNLRKLCTNVKPFFWKKQGKTAHSDTDIQCIRYIFLVWAPLLV